MKSKMISDNMKDRITDDGASEFALPNAQDPGPHKPMFYGKTPVPHPTNAKAKITNHAKVMGEVLEGK
jgi:hypothetical protein